LENAFQRSLGRRFVHRNIHMCFGLISNRGQREFEHLESPALRHRSTTGQNLHSAEQR
jgi:hypothetical protein